MLVPGRVLNAFFDFSIFFWKTSTKHIFRIPFPTQRLSPVICCFITVYFPLWKSLLSKSSGTERNTIPPVKSLGKKAPAKIYLSNRGPQKKQTKNYNTGENSHCFLKVRTVLNLHSFWLVTVFGTRFNINIYIYTQKSICVYIYIYLTLSVWDLSWTGIGKFHIVVLPTQWNPYLFIEKNPWGWKL